MRGTRYVCMDVEPGGKTSGVGYIGLCEVDASGVIGQPFFVSFLSPLWQGRHETDFPEVWAFVDAYLSGSLVAAFNARYDRSALRRLIAAVPGAGITPPEIRCVLEAARRHPDVLPSFGDLCDAVQRLKLLSEDEIEFRRRRFFDQGYGSKWMLNDAADDALACARLTVAMSGITGLSVSDLLHPVTARLR